MLNSYSRDIYQWNNPSPAMPDSTATKNQARWVPRSRATDQTTYIRKETILWRTQNLVKSDFTRRMKITVSIANRDNAASKKPKPALRVNITKQMRTIFTWERSRKKESFVGSASAETSTVQGFNRNVLKNVTVIYCTLKAATYGW